MKILCVSAAAVAALGLSSSALAAGQSGVAVKVDARSGLVAVATGKGAVSIVHAPAAALRGVRAGSRVAFDATSLRNGTLAATAFTVGGAVRRVHVRGMVLAVDPKHASFGLSAHGTVLRLRLARRARSLSASPSIRENSTDDVTVEFGAGGQLSAVAVGQVDPTTDAAALDGQVTASTGGHVTLASDGYAITLAEPGWLDPSKLAAGEHVIAYFVRMPDGSYRIEAVAADGSAAEADDANGQQGDVQNLEGQVSSDEQSGEQPETDQTGAQLAQNELASDEAGIANDLQEHSAECAAHVAELKAAGASAADLAAAADACRQQLAQDQQQAAQDLAGSTQELHGQVAGDAEAEQQLAQDAQQAEQDLQQSEQDAEQELDQGDGANGAGAAQQPADSGSASSADAQSGSESRATGDR